MGNVGPQQLLIVALIFVVLFGARKLPETAKGLAQSLRVFKKELRTDPEPPAGTAALDAADPEESTPTPPTPDGSPKDEVPAEPPSANS